MRQVVSFTVASALLMGGLYLLYIELMVAAIVMGKLVIAGAFVAFLGAAWLWADFIAPLLRGRETE
jgi:hypothetical protein